MRDIKYRGMSIDGKWHYGLLAYTEEKSLACGDIGWFISNKTGAPFAYQIRPETIGQFTGLHDKNGKEIYEGDIVKKNGWTCVVEWRENYAGFIINYIIFPHKPHVNPGNEWFNTIDGMTVDFEIIGNIYELGYLSNGK